MPADMEDLDTNPFSDYNIEYISTQVRLFLGSLIKKHDDE